MRYRTLDSNGDYVIGKPDSFLIDIKAVGQAIKTRLLLLLGEWWENTEDGLPLFQEILGVPDISQNKSTVDLFISQRILGTTGVTEIFGYKSSVEKRVYSAECSVNTIYGSVTVRINSLSPDNANVEVV